MLAHGRVAQPSGRRRAARQYRLLARAAAPRVRPGFDARYGTDTRRQLPVAAMRDVPDALAAHAVHYEASAIPKLRQALAAVRARSRGRVPAFSFLDVGSGKGLVVMLASRHPFREVVGVEMAPELHAIAERNAAASPQRMPTPRRCAS